MTALEKERARKDITGLGGSSLALVIAALIRKNPRPLLVITSQREKAEQLFDDLVFTGLENAFHFPAWEILPYEMEEPHQEIAARCLDVYDALLGHRRDPGGSGDKPPVIIAPIEALFQKVIPLPFFSEKCLRIRWGDRVNTDQLSRRLVSAGYERTSVVEGRGEFSIRGGIVDIYPLTETVPVRLDLFGEDIDSIRPFDPYTQRSQSVSDTIEEVRIPPAKLASLLKECLDSEIPLSSIWDNLDSHFTVILDEITAFGSQSHKFQEIVERQYFEACAREEWHTPPHSMYLNWDELKAGLDGFNVVSHTLLPPLEPLAQNPVLFHVPSFQDIRPSLDAYLESIRQRQCEGFLVCIICDNEGQLQRFDEILREKEISAVTRDSATAVADVSAIVENDRILSDVILTVGELHEGFLDVSAKIMLLTDREIFGRYRRRHVYRKVYKGKPVSAPSEILRGDFVVHEEHGIGRFLGIRAQQIDGKTVELFEIQYAGDARLLVPVEKIRFLQKYSIVQNIEPELDELGSKRWLARKKKTEEKIEEMATELLTLYARREIAERREFNEDTVWQTEFESSFIYEETPDQLTAIQQVKKDLCSPKPMDRLVCGDVGYGKTEVALRAAFKVVQEHKQVAVLAPTTILCQQHYSTFSERFAEYPFRVEMLSRFRTQAEQNKILRQVKNGEVHVIIGTHRLLSKDVEFLDLGLVIVDEEQRFGVRHKERLKELRAATDFLTLTATPIPRTLYMALSGLRDLSIINTPPPNRLPIRTKIIHWDDEMIREAVLRELNRGGQIFFVHNRVQSITHIEKRLQEIVPGLRIAVAHGQMNEHELEQVMLDFVDRKYDVLLSTTIIENGLDIPNVNTIIINRADALGLAQLYQLRGRVGRDVKRAYAYLITPSGEAITDSAMRRLAAIEEFTELGVGFNIAMRDLEIRGSGNLLGKEQHGCIVSIGFDLYCRLLEKTVKRLKGEQLPEAPFLEIKWPVECHIPSAYIPVESQRVGVYKRISEADNLEKVEDIAEELRDRYGALPDPVGNLLRIARLRIHAGRLGISRIQLTPSGFRVSTESVKDIIPLSESCNKAAKQSPDNVQISVFDQKTLHLVYHGWTRKPQLDRALAFLSLCPDWLPVRRG